MKGIKLTTLHLTPSKKIGVLRPIHDALTVYGKFALREMTYTGKAAPLDRRSMLTSK